MLLNLALTAPTGNTTVTEENKAADSILVVYRNGANLPVMLDGAGQLINEDQFVFATDTGSYWSCSVVHDGQMLIIGGRGTDEQRSAKQISVLDSCRLRRIGTLPIFFEAGACNTFTTDSGSDETLLCFYMGAEKECRSFKDNSVTSLPSANHDHQETSLGKHNNRPVAVGSGFGNKKVEEFYNGIWYSLADFPFAEYYIYRYSMVTFNDELYLFGGHVDGSSSKMAVKFTGTSWTQVGYLTSERYGHRSIVQGNSIMHIGGWVGVQNFERWTYNNDGKFDQEELDAKLTSYEYYPESFIVPANFCEL